MIVPESVRVIVNKARSQRAANADERARRHRLEEEDSERELRIVEKFGALVETVAQAKRDFAETSRAFRARYSVDYPAVVGQRLINDSARIEDLALQGSSLAWLASNLPKILEVFEASSVGAAEAELASFEKENAETLRKHGAIR